MSLNNCSLSEAKYYLSEHNNDFTRAIDAFNDDQAWAKNHCNKSDEVAADDDENSCCTL